MAVRSAPPPRANMVYTILAVVGVIAAGLGAAMIGVIVYNYVTREELRNPPPQVEGALPSWLEVV